MPSTVLGLRAAQDRELSVPLTRHDGDPRVPGGRRRAGGIQNRRRRIDAWRGAIRTSSRVHPRDASPIRARRGGCIALDPLYRQRGVRLAGGGVLRFERLDGDGDAAVENATVV